MSKVRQQEIFDKVARHLFTQGKPSVLEYEIGDTRCRYRGEDGTKCAIGILIKDEFYTPEIEDLNMRSDTVRKIVRLSLGVSRLGVGVADLLGCLQQVHDGEDPKFWPEDLRSTAMEFGLNADVVDEFTGAK